MISVSHAACVLLVHCWTGDFAVRIPKTALQFIVNCVLLASMSMVWSVQVQASQEADPRSLEQCTNAEYKSAELLLEKGFPSEARDKARAAITNLKAGDQDADKTINCLKDILTKALKNQCTGLDYKSAELLLEKGLPSEARDKARAAITNLKAVDQNADKTINCLKYVLSKARQIMLADKCQHAKSLEDQAAADASVTYESIRAKYREILENIEYAKADLSCAKEGLLRVAKADKQTLINKACEAAAAHLAVATTDGPVKYESVRAEYETILKNIDDDAKANRSCAVKGLLEVAEADKQALVEKACRAAEELQSFTTVDGPVTYEDVRTKYKAILQNDTYADVKKSCAYEGLAKATELKAQQELDIAKRYDAEGNLEKAKKHYQAALDLLPSNVEWRNALSALRKSRIKQQLTRLGELGGDAEVKKLFKESLKSTPDLSLPPEARSAFGIRLPLWSELLGHKVEVLMPEGTVNEISTRGNLHPQWFALKSYLLSLTLAELILLVALIVIVWRKFIWAKPTLAIEDFSWLKANDGNAKDFVTRVRAQLMGMTKGHGSDRIITFLHGPVAQVNLGSIPASFSRALGPGLVLQTIYSIYQFLFARTVLSVSGIVKSKEYAEVQMRRSGRIVAETLIQYEDYVQFVENNDECDAIKADNLLPQLVGIWVAYQSMRHPSTIVPRMISWILSLSGRLPGILGTSDWHSYSLFHVSGQCLAGSDLAQKAGSDLAQKALERALERDPNFGAARVNLATVMHMRSNSKPKLLRTHELLNPRRGPSRLKILSVDLTSVVELYRSAAVWLRMTIVGDPTGFAHLYRSAAVLLDLSCESEAKDATESNGKANEALKEAEKLKSRLWWARKFRVLSRSDFKAYITWRIPIAECLRLGLAVKAKEMGWEKLADKLGDVEKVLSSRFDAYSLYNLACTYAIFAEAASALDIETDPNPQGNVGTDDNSCLRQAKIKIPGKICDSVIRCLAEKALLHLEHSYEMADRVPASRAAIKIKKLSDEMKYRAKYDCAFAFFRKNYGKLCLNSDDVERLKILLNVEDNGGSSLPQQSP